MAAGTPTITIVGVKALHGADFAVIRSHRSGHPVVAAADHRSELTLADRDRTISSAVITKLEDCRLFVHGLRRRLTIHPGRPDVPLTIWHPTLSGFPTRLQAPFIEPVGHDPLAPALLVENIFENRLQHGELAAQLGGQHSSQRQHAFG